MHAKPRKPRSLTTQKKLLARTHAGLRGPCRPESPAWETGTPGVPALPGGKCLTPPHPDWLPSEKWAWSKICTGEPADFNHRYGKFLDPKKGEEWEGQEGERRKIRPEFLRMVLLHEPWRGATSNVDTVLTGALVSSKVSLDDSSIEQNLYFIACRLCCSFCLSHSKTKDLSFSWSAICEKLQLERAVIDGSLALKNAVISDVSMPGAMVKGQVLAQGLTVNRQFLMENIEIFNSLIVEDARFHSVHLGGANIGGQINITYVEIERELYAGRMAVAGDVFIRKSVLNQVELAGCSIGGDLNLNKTYICGIVSLVSARFESNVLVEGCEIIESFEMHSTIIGKDLVLLDNRMGKINIDHCQIQTVLLPAPSLPCEISMNGCVFSDAISLPDTTSGSVGPPSISDLLPFLAKQRAFSPQPYEHMAGLLRRAG